MKGVFSSIPGVNILYSIPDSIESIGRAADTFNQAEERIIKPINSSFNNFSNVLGPIRGYRAMLDRYVDDVMKGKDVSEKLKGMDDQHLNAMKRLMAFALAAQALPKKGEEVNEQLKSLFDLVGDESPKIKEFLNTLGDTPMTPQRLEEYYQNFMADEARSQVSTLASKCDAGKNDEEGEEEEEEGEEEEGEEEETPMEGKGRSIKHRRLTRRRHRNTRRLKKSRQSNASSKQVYSRKGPKKTKKRHYH